MNPRISAVIALVLSILETASSSFMLLALYVHLESEPPSQIELYSMVALSALFGLFMLLALLCIFNEKTRKIYAFKVPLLILSIIGIYSTMSPDFSGTSVCQWAL